MGIRAAAGELILFLDDDFIGFPDLLRQHCMAHSGSEPQIIHGPIYVAPGSAETIPRYHFELWYEDYYRSLSPVMEVRYPEGVESSASVLSSLVNSSMPRDILLRCGGFDEEIRASEDLELGLRLWKMGIPFRFRPTAIVCEYYVKSSREYLDGQAVASGAGDLLASRKHVEYRRYSWLSSFAETRTVKKWLRSVLIRLPVSLVPLLALPLRFEKRFCRFSCMRRFGVHWFRSVNGIARLRGALTTAGSRQRFEAEFDRRTSVLLYHHVGPWRSGTHRGLTVSPKEFERQMRWLARRGYVGIKPADWLRWQRMGTGLPKKPIIITFDDAYADIAEYALPILRGYGFNAVVFVVTGQLGGTNTWDEAQGCGTLSLMTADQIRYWAGHGIEFGAHSRTHPDLTKLSREECLGEIAGSKDDLTALLGSPVISFAYPYGRYNDMVYDSVRDHFDCGFSIEEGINYLKGDPLLVRRAYVGPGISQIEFALTVRFGGLKWFRDLRVKLAVRTRLKRALGRIIQPLSGWEH